MDLLEVEGATCRVEADAQTWRTIAAGASQRADVIQEYGASSPLADRYDDVDEVVRPGIGGEAVEFYLSELILAAEAMRWFARHAERRGHEDLQSSRTEIASRLEELHDAVVDEQRDSS